ncbi:MAG: HWE histidine kinase domain-containing protein [Caulobacteraceae bacterium]
MTPRRPPRPVDSAAGRLQRILHIAISLTGASAALIVLKDGEVAASAGTPPKGTAAAELAGFGLAFALEAEQGRARQDPAVAWRACAVRDAAGETLGALVLAAARAKAFAPGLDEALPELCALASDELGQAAAAAVLQAEREGLFAEVDHRVKNVIAAVQAMASQSARRAVSLDGFLKPSPAG